MGRNLSKFGRGELKLIDGIDGREKDRKGGGERRGKEGEEVKRGWTCRWGVARTLFMLSLILRGK